MSQELSITQPVTASHFLSELIPQTFQHKTFQVLVVI